MFAKRDFGRFQTWRSFKPKRLNGQPGLYLLRDEEKAPLFIGHTLTSAAAWRVTKSARQ